MHINADADTVGSGLVFAKLLQVKNKPHLLFCATALAESLRFLPRSNEIVMDSQQILNMEPDLIIALDASDLKIAGLENILPLFKNRPYIINIDHHQTNTNYGNLNLVIKGAASTTEIIFYLLQAWKIEITRETAELLLSGLMVDTGGFSNPATSASALEVAGVLIRSGASLKHLQKRFLQNKPVASLRLLGYIFQSIRLNKKYGAIFAIVREEDLIRNGLRLDDMDGLTNLFNYLDEGQFYLILREQQDGNLRCSMRANKNGIDVSRLAKIMGGGGHPKAAGFTIRGKIVKMENGNLRIV